MPTPARWRSAATMLTALAVFGVAGCGGSAISPEEARQANLGLQGATALGSTGGGGAVNPGIGGTDPSVGTGTGTVGTNPGTGSVGVPGGAGGTGSTGTGPPAGTGGTGSTSQSAGAGTKAGSCAGFKNGVGITDDTITIGNSADVSGPVPGLFSGPQLATKAYVNYFNATNPHGICGRKLVLRTYDSRTDAGADQQATQKMCTDVFASVGSLSAFDSGGAEIAQGCGLPDLRANITTAERNGCRTCFGADATGAHEYSNAVPDFFVKNYRAASQKAAYLYLSAGAAAENGKTQIAVESKRGMRFLYTAAIDVAEFNYSPYVQQMKSKGVEYVQFLGGYQQAVRLAQAMQAANFTPQVRHFDQTTDDPGYLKTGGSAVEGAITSLTYKPLFEPQPELDQYKRWLQQTAPGSAPNGFGLFGWSAAKLFVEQVIALGGRLNRATLVASLSGVHAWTGGGMHGPMDVGGKHAAECVRFEVVKNGRFAPIGPSRFLCSGITRAG